MYIYIIFIYRYLKRTSQWIRHPLTVSWTLNGEKIDDVKLGSTFWKMNFPEIRRSPVEVGNLSYYLQFFFYIPGGRSGFLPSYGIVDDSSKTNLWKADFFQCFFSIKHGCSDTLLHLSLSTILWVYKCSNFQLNIRDDGTGIWMVWPSLFSITSIQIRGHETWHPTIIAISFLWGKKPSPRRKIAHPELSELNTYPFFYWQQRVAHIAGLVVPNAAINP